MSGAGCLHLGFLLSCLGSLANWSVVSKEISRNSRSGRAARVCGPRCSRILICRPFSCTLTIALVPSAHTALWLSTVPTRLPVPWGLAPQPPTAGSRFCVSWLKQVGEPGIRWRGAPEPAAASEPCGLRPRTWAVCGQGHSLSEGLGRWGCSD